MREFCSARPCIFQRDFDVFPSELLDEPRQQHEPERLPLCGGQHQRATVLAHTFGKRFQTVERRGIQISDAREIEHQHACRGIELNVVELDRKSTRLNSSH
mgnify:CR=1 FL=1